LRHIMAVRIWRMRTICNAKWETIDNAVTLFLELLLQYLRNDGKDEFFGVPMTIFPNHPLNFSVGHLRHGEQMRTGFKTLYPESLDEDYDQGLSNICFETWITNRMKWNFDEDKYEEIHQDLRTVHLSTDHYSVPFECLRIDVKSKSSTQNNKWSGLSTEPDESDPSDNELEDDFKSEPDSD
jgi:hypothetical protein